jgi:peroxiredoxin
MSGLMLSTSWLKVVLFAGLVVGIGCSSNPPAADFSLTTFAGEEFRLSEHRGNAVVINFWYPSCPPCREEMPAFQEVWEEYQGRNVRFIGLFVPQGFDTEVEARQFVDEFGLTFDFATDVRARVAQEYAVQYFPTTYFIDQAGRVHTMEISRMDVERLTDILDDLAG